MAVVSGRGEERAEPQSKALYAKNHILNAFAPTVNINIGNEVSPRGGRPHKRKSSATFGGPRCQVIAPPQPGEPREVVWSNDKVTFNAAQEEVKEEMHRFYSSSQELHEV